MLEEVFHQCSLQSSLWWPHQWSLPQGSWKQMGRIEKLSGYTQSPAKITKFKRRQKMVRANSNNSNILPTNWVPALPDWRPALVLPTSSFTPAAFTFLTGFLSISHFNSDFLSLFQSSIALQCWQIDVNASSDNPTSLLKAVWISTGLQIKMESLKAFYPPVSVCPSDLACTTFMAPILLSSLPCTISLEKNGLAALN